jgi:light-regulated signal transduction histidine kinase (bacteriophytochrome)
MVLLFHLFDSTNTFYIFLKATSVCDRRYCSKLKRTATTRLSQQNESWLIKNLVDIILIISSILQEALMANERQKYWIRRFFTTKLTGQGTGLGLSLSYDIIRAHNREIKVETKEGEGAEFVLVLRG